MAIDKEIEILEARWLVPQKPMDPRFQAALLVGINALKRLRAWREDNDEDLLWDLPGETEE
ncbi:hypothetical protein ES703_70946 [subsurface metagenome]